MSESTGTVTATAKLSEDDFQAWCDLLNEKYGIANPIEAED
jgi:hypothetical protein